MALLALFSECKSVRFWECVIAQLVLTMAIFMI